MQSNRSVWAGRFIGLTFVLGGVAWAIIGVLVLGNLLAGMGNFTLGPASSRIVAGGGAGSWFVMGVLSFLIIGIAGTGLTSSFYQYVEGTLQSPLTGWRRFGAWAHLLLGCGVAAIAALVMAWAGFWAGVASLPVNDPRSGAPVGGWGRPEIVHAEFLGPASLPLAILMLLALLGYLIGGVVLTTAWRGTRKSSAA